MYDFIAWFTLEINNIVCKREIIFFGCGRTFKKVLFMEKIVLSTNSENESSSSLKVYPYIDMM